MRDQIRIGLPVALAFLCALLMGCEGDTGPQGPAGPQGPTGPEGPAATVTNATCLSSQCHGDSTLTKTIVNDLGADEEIPLYVDSTRFAATVHGDQLCVSCHSDINAAGGAHATVYKTFGGWARFSRKQAVEAIPPNETPRTRNYHTAASMSCITCHSDHSDFANSAHATIFKLREAEVDADLSALCGKTVGEDYEAGNCNRCHASCGTCHFKSTISRIGSASPLDYWDENQTDYPASGFNDNMSEFQMDWTTNVVSHDFRSGNYFNNDTEMVCEACHTGLYKPSAMAYYWKDEGQTTWDSVKASNVKRHPQTYSLAISGDLAFTAGGSNTTHAGYACADCHGSAVGDVHSLPGLPYEWSEDGDVQCVDCHSATHTNANVALHMDGTGTDVACIGCHTFGLARDFELESTGSSDANDVFLDPVTGEVRPVVYKHGAAVAWYSHNWQDFDAGTGEEDLTSDCAKKCHYSGNLVGATAW